jgi:hypothetical protein
MKYKLSVASRLHPGLSQAELDIPGGPGGKRGRPQAHFPLTTAEAAGFNRPQKLGDMRWLKMLT